MKKLFILFALILLLTPSAHATRKVLSWPANTPINVCVPSDANTDCGGGTGSSQWSDNAPNIYFSTGNVGLGSATPSQKLEVIGTVKAIQFIGDGSALTGIVTDSGWTHAGTVVYMSTSTNNVGIGTSVPLSRLSLVGAGTTSATNSLMIRDSLLNAKVTITDAGNVGVGSSAPEGALVVSGTGTNYYSTNVGIGTSTPNGALVVFGGNVGFGSTNPGSTLEVVGGGATSATSSVHVRDSALASKFIVNDAGNVGVGSSVPRQKVEVTGSVIVSANVGIGNTAPTQALVVTGAGTFSTNVGIGTTAVGSRLVVYGGNVGIGTTAPRQVLEVVGNIYNSGNIGVGTSAPLARLVVADGHLAFSQATPPVATTCGTSPTIVAKSTDSSGEVTCGTGSTKDCLITFNSAFNTAPHCVIQPEEAVGTFHYHSTTTTLTVTTQNNCDGADIDWICIDTQ